MIGFFLVDIEVSDKKLEIFWEFSLLFVLGEIPPDLVYHSIWKNMRCTGDGIFPERISQINVNKLADIHKKIAVSKKLLGFV